MENTVEQLKEQITQLEEQLEQYHQVLTHAQLVEQRFNHSMAVAQLAWWEWDLKVNKLDFHFNKANLLGYTKEELYHIINTDIASLIHPNDYKNVRRVMFSHLKGDTNVYECEYRIRAKNGKYVWFYDKGNVVDRTEDGKPLIFRGTVIDNSSLRKTISRLRKKEKQLTESNQAKDHFFSIIAHDLRGPFGAIMNLSRLYYDRYDKLSDEKKFQYIESIYKTSRSVYELLENLLDWSRIMRDKIEFTPERIQIDQLVDNLLGIYHSRIDEKKLHIIVNLSPEVKVYADKYMVNTVFRNLLANAIKFTPNKGKIYLYAERDNQFFNLYVEDTGVGMDEDKLATIFDKTSFDTQPGTGGELGSGLGLGLAKEFIERCGGKLWVNSQPKKGSAFGFSLPVADQN